MKSRLAQLIVAVSCAVILAAPTTALAQSSTALTIEARVSGKNVELWLLDIAEPVGALEIRVAGLAPLDGDCTVTGGFGACSNQDGVLVVVAVNPTGFEADGQLVDAKVDESIVGADVSIDVVQSVDVLGQPVAASTNVVSTPASTSSIPVIAGVGVVVAVAVIAFAGWRLRSSRNKAPQEDS